MKSKIISVIIVLILLLGSISGYFLYQHRTERKMISEKTNEINIIKDNFDNNTNRESKLELLKSTIQASSEYNKSKNIFPEISNKYKALILSMQKEFIEEYDNVIKENTIDDLANSEDINKINIHTENLNTLLTTIESEKEYTLSSDSEYKEYTEKISSLTEAYSTQIVSIEEKKKAEEEVKKQAEEESRKKAEEEKAKTHYENVYFSVDVPAEWADAWTVSEEDNSLNGITSIVYSFSYDGDNQTTYPGGAMVYVLDMSDTSRPLSEYSRMIPSTCEEIGVTSFGNYDVFKTEAGAGFFSYGATITLK